MNKLKIIMQNHFPNDEIATATEREDTTIPIFKPRSKRPKSGPVSGFSQRMKKAGSAKQLWMPALLATLTGVLLGVCLLVLFKGQATESAGAATPTTPPAGTQGQPNATQPANQAGGSVSLQGIDMYAWQVGSFNDLLKAQAAQKAIADKGVQAAIRQSSGVFQLYAGLAADKASGAAIENELKKANVNYYAKPYSISAGQGTMGGLTAQEASELQGVLKQEMNLAAKVLPLAVATNRDTKQVSNLDEELKNETQAVKTATDLLTKASQSSASAQLDAMHRQLAQAISALSHPSVLPSEGFLTAFYIDYEALSAQLVKTQG